VHHVVYLYSMFTTYDSHIDVVMPWVLVICAITDCGMWKVIYRTEIVVDH